MNVFRGVVALAAVVLVTSVAVADDDDSRPLSEGAQRLMDDFRGEARIRADEDGNARFVRLPSDRRRSGDDDDDESDEKSKRFFRSYGDAFGVEDSDTELKAVKTVRDATGAEHAIFRQAYNEIPVFGGELRTHFNASGQMTAVNGTFVAGLKINMTPRLSAEQAADIAIARVQIGDPAAASLDSAEPRLNREEEYLAGSRSTDLSAVSNQLLVFREGLLKGTPGEDHLAYEVEVRNEAVTVREFVYVDAHTGKVIDQITGIHEALHRTVSESSLSNVVWSEGDTFPTGNADWNNEIDGAGETYNVIASLTAGVYLSYDGVDAIMKTVNNDPGINCPNANWNGISTNYCTGVTGDDTVAHEWGHAYTDFTSNLIYQWQSGALNESYSDIWGEVVDLLNGRGSDDLPGALRTDGGCSILGTGAPAVDNIYRWLSGEDDPAFGGAIRDMWNPVCYGDPGKVTDSQYWCSAGDSGGVHTNSGVPNHAFALMVDGGNYNGATITGLGLTKAAHIHWAAQNMLTLTSNFVDQADALEAACSALTGVDLPALSTSSTNAGLSGEIITAAECATVAQINTAVEFRTTPSQCGFEPMLEPDAPALCEALGNVQTIAFEDFEGGVLPAGWTASSHDVANPATFDTPNWDVFGDLPAGAGGNYAAFAPDLLVGDCGLDTEAGAVALDSPVIALPAGVAPHVAFDHWVATETAWDGGNLKVSVNGGPYVVVPSAAYSFNAYNGTLNVSDNPLGGEEAFTGADEGSLVGSWGQSQVDLYGLAFPGDNIQLRFDLGVDGCNGNVGWYVDSFHAYSCSAEELPVCGDGQIDLGEMCDDGNSSDGDGCSTSCAVEDGWACSDRPATNNANVLADWSFEGGVPNADWTATSTFGGIPGFPLCGPGNNCGAGVLATTGSWNVWVGGLSAGVTSSVEQNVTIPFTATDLTVQVWRGLCDDAGDTLHVSLDGSDIGTVTCDATDGGSVLQTFSVAGYNDGGTHTLYIGGTVGGTNGTHTNFFVDDVIIGDNVFTPATPSMCERIVEDLSCNAGPVGFDEGIADTWTVVDNIGLGLTWSNIALSGEGGNYTGGSGDAASVSSDAFGPADFDTELRSNVFSLANATSASFSYLVNYQNFASFDFLDLDISTDGGASWTNLVSWNEDHPPGGLRNAPGETVSIDLTAYLGESNVQLSWRYYDPTTFDWDWYAQVDDIEMACDLTGSMTGEGSVGDEDEHEFSLSCQDGARRNRLEIEWEDDDEEGDDDDEYEFRLTELTQALCSDRPGLDEGRPDAGFDTFIGAGSGRLNGKPASITFRFTDAGEPGRADEARYTITTADGVVTTVSGKLDEGNHQARQARQRNNGGDRD